MNTKSFSVSAVSRLRSESGNAWLEFFDVPSLSMGVYQVPAGTGDRDSHTPHDRDEIYIGVSGKGQLTADGEVFEVEEGAIVYVKAGVEHYFHDVSHDLTVLVFFASKT